MSEDLINHPSHYTFGTIEVLEYIDSLGCGYDFAKGNAIKYIARAYHKGKPLEDLKKARFYVQHMLDQQKYEKDFESPEEAPEPIHIDDVLDDWQMDDNQMMAIYRIVCGGHNLKLALMALNEQIMWEESKE